MLACQRQIPEAETSGGVEQAAKALIAFLTSPAMKQALTISGFEAR
jgi:hypothetical protein